MSPRVDPMYCYRLAAALALILTLSVCGGSNARALATRSGCLYRLRMFAAYYRSCFSLC